MFFWLVAAVLLIWDCQTATLMKLGHRIKDDHKVRFFRQDLAPEYNHKLNKVIGEIEEKTCLRFEDVSPKGFEASRTKDKSLECWRWACQPTFECKRSPEWMEKTCPHACEVANGDGCPLMITSEDDDSCHMRDWPWMINLAGNDKKTQWCTAHLEMEVFHALGFAHESHNSDMNKYLEPEVRRNMQVKYESGYDETSIMQMPGFRRRRDDTVVDFQQFASDTDWMSLNHVYCGGTWCMFGGFLPKGNTLKYGILDDLDNPLQVARTLCDGMGDCTGFTVLGTEVWLKAKHKTVYGDGESALSADKNDPSMHLWQTWLKCPDMKRRTLQETDEMEVSEPALDFKNVMKLPQVKKMMQNDLDKAPDTPDAKGMEINTDTMLVLKRDESENPQIVSDINFMEFEDLITDDNAFRELPEEQSPLQAAKQGVQGEKSAGVFGWGDKKSSSKSKGGTYNGPGSGKYNCRGNPKDCEDPDNPPQDDWEKEGIRLETKGQRYEGPADPKSSKTSSKKSGFFSGWGSKKKTASSESAASENKSGKPSTRKDPPGSKPSDKDGGHIVKDEPPGKAKGEEPPELSNANSVPHSAERTESDKSGMDSKEPPKDMSDWFKKAKKDLNTHIKKKKTAVISRPVEKKSRKPPPMQHEDPRRESPSRDSESSRAEEDSDIPPEAEMIPVQPSNQIPGPQVEPTKGRNVLDYVASHLPFPWWSIFVLFGLFTLYCFFSAFCVRRGDKYSSLLDDSMSLP